MKKLKKRILSVMLILALICVLVPGRYQMSAIAANEPVKSYLNTAKADFAGPTLIADCSKAIKPVNPSMFGYILTPNYDVPENRISMLGPVLNRETIPVQTFQAIGDLDGSYWQYENSIKERHLSAYRRVKDAGGVWYMLMGMNPSWAAPTGSPTDDNNWTQQHVNKKTPEQIADFKQYIKDVLQYMKDNGAKPDFANLTNEYWTGTELTYKGVWEALREVYPEDIPALGPDAVGYSGIPDFYINYAAANDITIEGPAWHSFWHGDDFATYTQLQAWYDNIANLQKQNKKVNGKYIVWGENNAGTGDPLPLVPNHTHFARSMANVVRTGIEYNIKGCLEDQNWNGMGDLLTTKGTNANTGIRRELWWTFYMFSQLAVSGNYVEVSVPNAGAGQTFTGAAAVDEEEETAKVIFTKNNAEGPVLLALNNIPFPLDNVTVDLYKVTDVENDGLQYQMEVSPQFVGGRDLELYLDDLDADTTWMAIVKTNKTRPEFFHQITPDDGEVAVSRPTFTWSKSRGADSYTLTVSKNKDLSDPVIVKEGLTTLNDTSDISLDIGEKYYWSVTAFNANGSRTVSQDVKYSLLIGEDTQVPGQFAAQLPSPGAKNESRTLELKWTSAYSPEGDPVSYHLIISENEDFSDPVFDRTGITSVRNTGHFGPNSQAYFQVPSGTLDYSTTYYWTVYAVNSHGERPMNGSLNYFTTQAVGNGPLDFNLVYPLNGAVGVVGRDILEWEESPNAFFYKLEISDQPDMSNIVLQRNHMIYNRYTLEQNALEPGKTYYWRVTALNKQKTVDTVCGNGIWSFSMEETATSPLLYAEQPGDDDGTVQLWFHSSDKADSYNIYYGKKEGFYTRKISGVSVNSGSNGTYTVTGLKGGQTYYFAITAVNAKGESDIWNERSVAASGDGVGWTETDEEGERINSWTVNVTAGAGGTVKGGGTYDAGVDITLTAIPNMGYTFTGWYENGIKVYDKEQYGFTVEVGREIEARFNVNQYKITTVAGTGGSVKGGGIFDHGATVTLTATPDLGYRFVRWLEGSSQVSANVQYTFTANKERTLKAEFTKSDVKPQSPTSLKVKSTGYNSLSLSWRKTANASGYEIYRAVGRNKNYTKIKTVKTASYKDSKLVTGKKYFYKVCAVYTVGTEKIISEASKPESARPVLPKVHLLNIKKLSSSTNRLSWKKVKGAFKYEVYRATGKNGKYTRIAIVKKTSYKDSHLRSGNTYHYKVRAFRKVKGKNIKGKFSGRKQIKMQ